MMQVVRGIVIAGTGVFVGLMAPGPATAAVVTCDDIAAAQSRGQTVEAIKRELRTTSAHIQACAHLADMHAQQNARRGVARARRAARRGAIE
jgi:hypothetical protein